MLCKICFGSPVIDTCFFCGAKKDDERRKELKKLYDSLCKSQSRGTGVAGVDEEIRSIFGDWLRKPTPLYESPIKVLYTQAFTAEQNGDKKAARKLYKQLYGQMTNETRINYRITRDVIFLKLQELKK